MNPINQFINFFRRGKVYFIVGGIAFFYLINNFIWLRQNTYPYGPDEFKHLIYALRFFKEISLNILNIFALFSSHQSGLYPPFYYISTAIFSLFFGTSYLSLVMVNMLYFIILLFSVYFIAVKLFNNRTAVISIIIISLYPMVFRYSRFFGLDFPLIAMVSLSICCLIYSDYFTDKKFTLLSGLCLGLGTLTKWTYIIFLIGPLAFIVSKSLICENNQGVIRERRIMNFSLFLIIGALLSMIWYLPNANKLRAAKMFFSSFSLYSYKIDPGQSYHAIFQFHKFIDSFLRLINDEISLLFFLLFSFAFVFFVFKCRNRLFLILWYAFPYIFFSLPSHSEARYILPALPALALISAAGLESITYKKTKRVLYSAVLLTALIQFFDISYNSERNKHTLPFSTRIGTVYAFYCPTTESPRDWVYGPPVKKNWGLQSIVNSILRSDKDVSVSDTFFNKVGVICGDNYVGKIFDYPGALNYYFSRSAKINYNTASLLYDEEILDFIDNLRNLKYIIFISKEDSFPQFEKLDGAFNQLLSLHSAKFKNPELINLIKTSKFTNIPLTNVDDIFIKEANTDLKEFLSQTDKLRLIDKIRLPEGYYAYIYDPGHGLRGLRRGLLNLRFLKGNLYFWHKNNLINAQKIGSIVQHKNQLYNSQEAVWKLNTINDYTLQAKGVWRNLPGLTQIWQISLKDEREVDCEVAVENAGADLSDLKAAQLKL
ncbi:MAG: phospholipid carrier-dependent glycosyltransferase, partial [Candidatus Omnitrophica bacterium]|nr:phospholipid carrier-dependent glycosyltransferase [Candidatus Omnitrophota bacterium]